MFVVEVRDCFQSIFCVSIKVTVCAMIISFLFNRNWMTLTVVKVDLVQQDVTKVDSGRVCA